MRGGVLFGNKTIYIPKEDYKRELVQMLRKAADGARQTPHDMALLLLLKESKNLSRYFSESE